MWLLKRAREKKRNILSAMLPVQQLAKRVRCFYFSEEKGDELLTVWLCDYWWSIEKLLIKQFLLICFRNLNKETNISDWGSIDVFVKLSILIQGAKVIKNQSEIIIDSVKLTLTLRCWFYVDSLSVCDLNK